MRCMIQAVAVNPDINYSLVRAQEGPMEGECFFIATERIEALSRLKLPSSDGEKTRRHVGPMDELAVVKGELIAADVGPRSV